MTDSPLGYLWEFFNENPWILFTGLWVGGMLSFFIINWTRSFRTTYTVQARVVEKQTCPLGQMAENGELSYCTADLAFQNGALDEYTLWIELLNTSLVRQLGLKQICRADGCNYRREWESIPKHAKASATLQKVPGVGWQLMWVELMRDATGDFIVLNE